MKETVLKQSVSIVLPIKLFVCSLLYKSLQLIFLLLDCHRVELPGDIPNVAGWRPLEGKVCKSDMKGQQ